MARFEGFKCDRCAVPHEGRPKIVTVDGIKSELCDVCAGKVERVLDGADPDGPLDDDP